MQAAQILSRRAGRLATFLTVASLVVIVDQATKAAVCHLAPLGTPARTFIPNVLDLYHVENTGAAFSMGEGAGPLFALLALGVFVGAIIWTWREELPIHLVAFIACVAGGGIGNMVDRIVQGSVTDFLATTFIDFPIFNVADIFVTCGVVLTLIGYTLWDSKRQRELARVEPDAVPDDGSRSDRHSQSHAAADLHRAATSADAERDA